MEIVAIFTDGEEVTYTTEILELLKSDKTVKTIYNAKTGEVIHFKN